MTPSPAVADAATALVNLQRLVATVTQSGSEKTAFDRALGVLESLSRKENIPLAIIGGLAAIRHGYPRYTQDIDIVVGELHLDVVLRVAPKYGIKVVWHDPHGWHKLSYEGVRIEIVPEGGRARNDAPTTIPGPTQLGVRDGVGYASLPGWVETKLSSGRRQDEADVVQVLKQADTVSVAQIREHVAGVHPIYLQLFEELQTAAEDETRQERERGGQL